MRGEVLEIRQKNLAETPNNTTGYHKVEDIDYTYLYQYQYRLDKIICIIGKACIAFSEIRQS